MSSQQLVTRLAKGLHKPIIGRIKKRKLYSSFRDNICGSNLADMQLISKFNKEICYLSCAIDIFSKRSWVVSLKDKKVLQLLRVFKKCYMILAANQTKYG